MANINEVFGEYDPNKPYVSFDKDILQAIANLPAQLPQNPAEGLYNTFKFAKEQLPIINAENPEDAIKEALLWFVPVKGGARKAVKLDKAGMPKVKDLADWEKSKSQQIERLREKIKQKDPTRDMSYYERQLASRKAALESNIEFVNKNANNLKPIELKYQNQNIEKLRKDIFDLENKINELAIDGLDYHGMTLKDYEKIVGESVLDNGKYIQDKFMQEFKSLPADIRKNLYVDMLMSQSKKRGR